MKVHLVLSKKGDAGALQDNSESGSRCSNVRVKPWMLVTLLCFLQILSTLYSMEMYDSRVASEGGKLKEELLFLSPEEQKQTFYDEDTDMSPSLALVDAYLLGGFRNQHMRLVSLANHAFKNGMKSLLLDSLQWGNTVVQFTNDPFPHVVRIPHAYLFDVDYWNTFAWRQRKEIKKQKQTRKEQWNQTTGNVSKASGGSTKAPVLPYLMPFSPELHHEWNNVTKLFWSVSADTVLDKQFKPRKNDLMPNVTKCTRPYGYGSGKSGGRLWYDYFTYLYDLPDGDESENRTNMRMRGDIEIAMYRALQPSIRLQPIIDSFLHTSDGSHVGDLVAIHPRCEIDMLLHVCSKFMVGNLTRIFEMVEESPYFSVQSTQDTGVQSKEQASVSVGRVFLCVGRAFMSTTNLPSGNEEVGALANYNYRILDQVTKSLQEGGGLWNNRVPVLEGGEEAASGIEGLPPQAHGLVAQVINFFIAVRASAFVGTYGSSYSTDVWTVRYYLGKGDGNFYHGPDGLHRVPDGGLPRPHTC